MQKKSTLLCALLVISVSACSTPNSSNRNPASPTNEPSTYQVITKFGQVFTRATTPSGLSGQSLEDPSGLIWGGIPDQPMSFEEAELYCKAGNARLPTEMEFKWLKRYLGKRKGEYEEIYHEPDEYSPYLEDGRTEVFKGFSDKKSEFWSSTSDGRGMIFARRSIFTSRWGYLGSSEEVKPTISPPPRRVICVWGHYYSPEAPGFLSMPRDEYGKQRLMSRSEANKYCLDRNAHLPKIREFDFLLESFYNKNILTVADGLPVDIHKNSFWMAETAPYPNSSFLVAEFRYFPSEFFRWHKKRKPWYSEKPWLDSTHSENGVEANVICAAGPEKKIAEPEEKIEFKDPCEILLADADRISLWITKLAFGQFKGVTKGLSGNTVKLERRFLDIKRDIKSGKVTCKDDYYQFEGKMKSYIQNIQQQENLSQSLFGG